MSEYRAPLLAQLEARKAELSERLTRLDQDARRATEPLAGDFADQATQSQNDEVVDRLREATVIELGELATTLSRLRDGDYGECMKCGMAIEPGRLHALPHTSYCIACAGEPARQ